MKNKTFILIGFYLFVILLGCYLIYTKTEVKEAPLVSRTSSITSNNEEKNDGFGISYTIYSKRIKEKILSWKNDVYSSYQSSKVDFSYEIVLNNKQELILKLADEEYYDKEYKIASDVIDFRVISGVDIEKVYFINGNGTVGSLDLLKMFFYDELDSNIINPIADLQEIVSINSVNEQVNINKVAFVDIRGNMYINIEEKGKDV